MCVVCDAWRACVHLCIIIVSANCVAGVDGFLYVLCVACVVYIFRIESEGWGLSESKCKNIERERERRARAHEHYYIIKQKQKTVTCDINMVPLRRVVQDEFL